MKIIFVTHGQTLDNAEGILIGQLPGEELSSLGQSQARELGESLKDVKIDCAYSSDLSRAVQTARDILKHHVGLRLVLTEGLRERSYGALQGKKKSEIGWYDEMVYEDHAGFEPLKDLRSRVEKFLLKIEKQHKDDTVLLVAHRNLGIVLESVVRGIPLSELRTVTLMKTGGMRTFEYNGKKTKVTA